MLNYLFKELLIVQMTVNSQMNISINVSIIGYSLNYFIVMPHIYLVYIIYIFPFFLIIFYQQKSS